MRAEGLLTKEAVIGAMHPQAKDTREWQQRPEAGKRLGAQSPSQPPEGASPAHMWPTPQFWTSDPQSGQVIHFRCCKPPACGHLLGQP